MLSLKYKLYKDFIMRLLSKTLLVLATALSAQLATAAPLTLTRTLGADRVQQTANNPCIFGDSSCNAGALGTYVNWSAGGNNVTYDSFKEYSLTTIRSAVGNLWNIGIDVSSNDRESETLQFFKILLDGQTLYSYTGPTNIAQNVSNGTGYSDWLLSAIDLTGLVGTTLRFEAKITGGRGNTEQIFIVDRPESTNNVPVPGTLALMGLGLLGLARKKFAKA
jgi:PEP-CTERM motif